MYYGIFQSQFILTERNQRIYNKRMYVLTKIKNMWITYLQLNIENHLSDYNFDVTKKDQNK